MEGNILERITYAASLLEASRDVPEDIRAPLRLFALAGPKVHGGLHSHSAGEVARELAERIEDGILREVTLRIYLSPDGYHLEVEVLDAQEGEAVRNMREVVKDVRP